MKYSDWSKIYSYGMVLGSIATVIIFLVLMFLGLDKILPVYVWVLVWGIIVILFVIGAWYFLVKKK
jgi:amino acid transporter